MGIIHDIVGIEQPHKKKPKGKGYWKKVMEEGVPKKVEGEKK